MMSEDLKAIFSQFRRLDAMAQVAGGRINDQAAITKQMTQLLTALRKTNGNYQSAYLKLFYKQEKCQKISIAAFVFAVAAFVVAVFK